MIEERSVDKLARYVMAAAGIAIVCFVCWYFRSTLIYIILAAVVSLVGRPVMRLLSKIKIRGRQLPSWLLAIVTLAAILLLFIALITQLVPLVSSIGSSVVSNIGTISETMDTDSIMEPVKKFNMWVISTFPAVGPSFKIEDYVTDFLTRAFNIKSVSTVIGSVASYLASFGIGTFSVVFISFFFIKDGMLFKKIIGALVPDKFEEDAISAVGEIEHLLSRYFVGLIIEIAGVGFCNCIGLWTIGGLNFTTAIGIAFMTAILNVIPYVGPWIGAAIGTLLGTVIKVSTVMAAGGEVHISTFVLILICIFVFTQMIDNFFFQPFIYSTSIKASALEIFIVLLLAAHVGGAIGMLVAIPAYTVIRVIASRFFYEIKAIRRLIPDKEKDHLPE